MMWPILYYDIRYCWPILYYHIHIGHHVMYISTISGLDSTFASDNHGQDHLHILNLLANTLLSYQVIHGQADIKVYQMNFWPIQ